MSEAKREMKQVLLGMGFQSVKIDQVLPQCQTKEQAIEYLINQKQQPQNEIKAQQNGESDYEDEE